MRDEIIQELWRIKDELARETKYDVHVLCRQLRKRQASAGTQIVDRSIRDTDSDVVGKQAEKTT